jgi:hypothetical protein
MVTPTGVSANNRGSEEIHPEEAESDFRSVYAALDAFRREKKRLPTAKPELLDFAKQKGLALTSEDFVSVDVRKSDSYAQGMHDHLDYRMDWRGSRPKGERKPAFPKAGEKDAWLTTDIFVRSNTTLYPDMTAKNNPSGFFLVLWSDGSVERIRQEDQVWVAESDGFTSYFPGQTGVPRGALTNRRLNKHLERAVPAGLVPGPRRSP